MTEAELIQVLTTLPGAGEVRHEAGCLRIDVDRIEPSALAAVAERLELRLGAITGTPLAPVGETALVYHFVADDRMVDIGAVTRGNSIPSVTPHFVPASWAEREIHDLFDVAFPGHPDLSPLMRPEGFSTGMMRAPMCATRRRLVSDLSE